MNNSQAAEILVRIEEGLTRAIDALKPFESGRIEARLKSGGDPVTEADLAVNRVLHRTLLRNAESWLSEESGDDRERLINENVWVVDPLDGTREFLAGIPEWCVSIAYVHQGTAVAGGIVNPATGEMFLGSRETGVTYNGKKVFSSPRTMLSGATVLASRSEVKRGEWTKFQDAPFRIEPMGSIAYKLARVAAGLADVTWTLTPKHEWDVAAGVALVEAAGGVVRTPELGRLVFNQPSPLLSGLMAFGPKLESEVISFLAPYIAQIPKA